MFIPTRYFEKSENDPYIHQASSEILSSLFSMRRYYTTSLTSHCQILYKHTIVYIFLEHRNGLLVASHIEDDVSLRNPLSQN
jgi:hypothetical protein